MSTLARVVFAALVAATFGAFFVAQRLKNEPTVVQQFKRSEPLISPNGDGRLETVAFNFKLREPDDVRLDVVDTGGDVVRALDARRLPAYSPRRFTWNGRDDAGRTVPDGTYRLRITLRGAGRTIVPRNAVRVDTTPPRPRVLSVGPATNPTPELVPTATGEPARIRFEAPGGQDPAARRKRTRVTIWRTDGERPERVTSSAATLTDAADRWAWNGRVGARRVRPGTYLAVVESRDAAGNVGFSVPMRDGLPRLDFGRRLPGRAGITVRYLGVQPPSVPIIAGEKADVFIDARGERWRYTLRRIGEPRPQQRSRRAGTGVRLPLRAPRTSGVYLLEVRTRTRRTQVPIVVQEAAPVGRVLVVLPWITWQGRNLLDDDGDGRPNTLDAGVGVRADRILAGGLPRDFGIREAPVLAFLDRTGRDYDVTTDLALVRGVGPKLDEFAGALLPGDARWLPAGLGRQLRRFAEGGGTVVSLGTESLRRQVELVMTESRRQRLTKPTNATRTDLFGAVIADVRRGPTELTVAEDEVELFAGDEGVFPGVSAYEATGRLDGGAELVASAVASDGRPVIVAARLGRGLVVRTGVPDFPQRLTPQPESAALMNRLWVLMRERRG